MTEEPENKADMDGALQQLEAAIYRLEGRLDGLFSRLEGQRNQMRDVLSLGHDADKNSQYANND